MTEEKIVIASKRENSYLTRSATSAMNADMVDSETAAWPADFSTPSALSPVDNGVSGLVDDLGEEFILSTA